MNSSISNGFNYMGLFFCWMSLAGILEVNVEEIVAFWGVLVDMIYRELDFGT